MPSIRELPRAVVDRIAAGEVIERPACVIKELVENSIDAGAKRVDVEVDGAGLERIRIVDDGCGIPPDELPLAVKSHATSKLADTEDLFHIRTMGFRGEALASIASVSFLTVVSRTADRVEGATITNRGTPDAFEPVRPAGAPPGTSIEVAELFYNVPARKRFLKTARTELGHVDRALQRTCLPRSGVAFRLVTDGREVLHVPGDASLRNRIGAFFGNDLAERLIEAESVGDDVAVHGFVGPPDLARSNAAMIHFFVNGRFVQDRSLLGAIADAYRDYQPSRRYPVVFLFLEMPPEEVDVNVHPRKLEVRFRHPERLFPFVRAAAGRAIEPRPVPVAAPPAASPVRSAAAPAPAPAPASTWPGRTPVPQGASVVRERTAPIAPAFEPGSAPGRVFQVHGTYLVEETPGGIRIIDQHAYHERVLYFRFRARLETSPLESQVLLLPVTVEVDAGEMESVAEHQELLGRAGLEVEPFGPTTAIVRRVPAALKSRDPEPFLREVLESLRAGRFRGRVVEPLDALLATLSCKSAVRAGDRLTEREMQDLLGLRETVPHADTCPHGRPTTWEIPIAELEKNFHRR